MSLIEEVNNLIFLVKNTNVIFREFEFKPRSIATFICSIANSEDGFIIIGASEDEHGININGVSSKFNFQNVLENALNLLSEKPILNFGGIFINEKHLFVVKVFKNQNSITIDGQKYKLLGKEIIKCEGEVTLDTTKVFIVHGHDNEAKQTTARFIEKLGLEAIILHEQASKGMTIIEKIEDNSNVGFAIILYTPCDVGKSIIEGDLNPRARQNVVFEHGYLIGKIGRNRVCALVKGNIEKPNDISGVVYIDMDNHESWKMQLAKEMRSAGYTIDMNKI